MVIKISSRFVYTDVYYCYFKVTAIMIMEWFLRGILNFIHHGIERFIDLNDRLILYVRPLTVISYISNLIPNSMPMIVSLVRL